MSIQSTEKLYYDDPYMTEAEASVISCEKTKNGWEVILDRTIFYPEGGGQPSDRGYIGDIFVKDVHERNGLIVHYCDGEPECGRKVRLRIDSERRFDHMQQHSGEHIVSGMLCSAFSCDNVGFHMGEDVVTIDYNAAVSREELSSIEERANRYIWEDHECVITFPDEQERKALSYRSKKEIDGELRIVSFPGADTCACCGTHVRRSGEVGLVKFVSLEGFHGGSRIGLLCGKRAFEYLSSNAYQNDLIARDMSASSLRTYELYLKQKDELSRLRGELSAMEEKYLSLYTESFRGRSDAVLFEEGLSNDSLRKTALALSGAVTGSCAVFTPEGDGFRYAVKLRCEAPEKVIKEMNAALRGRGGGRDGFAQGSVCAPQDEIISFLKSTGIFSEIQR